MELRKAFELRKARSKKYVRRVKLPSGKFRYIYKESGSRRSMEGHVIPSEQAQAMDAQAKKEGYKNSLVRMAAKKKEAAERATKQQVSADKYIQRFKKVKGDFDEPEDMADAIMDEMVLDGVKMNEDEEEKMAGYILRRVSKFY